MDIDSKALHIFKGFIDDLIKVFPEYKIVLYENYSDILGLETLKIRENQKIKDFLKKIDSISTEITDKNESIFENDLFLLKDVCFKKIWSSNISDKTKQTIWKYLQSFCLINININTLEKLNGDDNLSDKKISRKSKKDLENYQKINEDFSTTGNDPSNEDLSGFNNILENTNIGKIAKEITEELNLGDDSSEADMKEVFNPENMMKIFSSINSKISDNGDLSKEDLASEATNICSTMKDNPLFSQLMGLQSTMFSQMGQQGQQSPDAAMQQAMQSMQSMQSNPNTRNISVSNNKEGDRNAAARKKAKSKLDKRNKVKVNKSD